MLGYLFIEELFILKFDIGCGSLCFIDKDRNIMHKDRELILGNITAIEQTIYPELALTAKVKEHHR